MKWLIFVIFFFLIFDLGAALQCYSCIDGDENNPCDMASNTSIATCPVLSADGEICQVKIARDGTLTRGCGSGLNRAIGYSIYNGELYYRCIIELCNNIDICYPNFTMPSLSLPTQPTINPGFQNPGVQSPMVQNPRQANQAQGKSCYNCTNCAIPQDSNAVDCGGPMSTCGLSWTMDGSMNRTCSGQSSNVTWGKMGGRMGAAPTLNPPTQMTVIDQQNGILSYQCFGNKCNNLQLQCYHMLNSANRPVIFTSIFIIFFAIFVFIY